jgi:CRP-like cAMP-binding protein
VSKIGKEATIAIISEGQFLGEGSLAGQLLRTGSAVAMTDCEILRVEKTAVEANLVRAMFDREHTTEMTVPTAENKLEHSRQHLHKSCDPWRRSKLPLASSHSNSQRTLA